MSKDVRIAVDFDGTIVRHEFPAIGEPNPGAIECLKACKAIGAKIILWTMRSDGQEAGDVLTDAIEYCRNNGVEFDAVNEGIGDREWTKSNKAYANIYIDDNAVGCPISDGMVDWNVVAPIVIAEVERRMAA